MNPVSSSRLRALLRPANGIALLALCLALGGTAVAAAAITGKLVKDNSLTGRDVRNRSLTRADFRGSLRGPAGPRGAAGADGERGPIGTPGTPGAPGATNVTDRQSGELHWGQSGECQCQLCRGRAGGWGRD